MGEKMRLVTRSDFDGLACAMMLKELDLIVILMSPSQATLPYMAYTYSNSGFQQPASAVSIVMFVMVFFFYWIANKFFHADIAGGM